MRHLPLLTLFVFATTFPAVADRGPLELVELLELAELFELKLKDVKPKFHGEVISESLGEVFKEKIGADNVIIEKARKNSFRIMYNGTIKYYSLKLNIFLKSKPHAFEDCYLYPHNPLFWRFKGKYKYAAFYFLGCTTKPTSEGGIVINSFYIYPNELKPGGIQTKKED